MQRSRVLLTGATGFVGRHAHAAIEAAGFDVLGATRHPAEASRDASGRRYRYFDLGDRASVEAALRQVDRAVYLVHGMAEGAGYEDVEDREARTFRDAAERAGLERIVYLGGMLPAATPSRHLASRVHTGEILRAASVPTIELRATMIVGGGSESFRIVRDLAARLPVMLLPRWLRSVSEPVGIDDVVAAIVHALSMPLTQSAVYELPGPERMSGRDMILRTARLLGQTPRVVEVPVVTPRLSSYWIRLVTRANPHIATELVEGLRSDIVSHGAQLWDRMPEHRRVPFDEAARRALRDEARALPRGARWLERGLHRLARA